MADVFRGAKIVNDSIDLCVKNGETHHAVEEGIIQTSDIYGEIGQIILGQKPAGKMTRRSPFSIPWAWPCRMWPPPPMLYRGALEKGLGTKYAFFA